MLDENCSFINRFYLIKNLKDSIFNNYNLGAILRLLRNVFDKYNSSISSEIIYLVSFLENNKLQLLLNKLIGFFPNNRPKLIEYLNCIINWHVNSYDGIGTNMCTERGDSIAFQRVKVSKSIHRKNSQSVIARKNKIITNN